MHEIIMGSIHSDELESEANYWNVGIKHQGVEINCKADASADAIVLEEHVFKIKVLI